MEITCRVFGTQFIKRLLWNLHCVLGTIPGAGYTAVNETKPLTSCAEETDCTNELIIYLAMIYYYEAV